MTHVLITGAGGFIGSHLVESQLTKGHHVRAVDLHFDRLSHLVGEPRLEIVVQDLTHARAINELVPGIDVIYHLASAHLEIRASAARYAQVNVDATRSLLAAAKAAGVGRLVHCSSVGVFGELSSIPATETTACSPTNLYERTKLAGEIVALELGRQSEFPVLVARPAWVYGPRCPRTRKLFDAIRRRRFVLIAGGKALRQPLYVADAVRGLELCAQTERVAGSVFLLAGAERLTIRQLVDRIAGIVNAPPPTIEIPVLPAEALGIAVEAVYKIIGREPPFSRRSLDFFLKDNAYDISRAQRELRFEPQTHLSEGLQRTWRYLKSQEHRQLASAYATPD